MTAPPTRPATTPPLLTLFLAAVGLGSVSLAFLSERLELASRVEEQLVRAQGSLSRETLVWLQGPVLFQGLLYAGVIFLALAGLCLFFRPAFERVLHRWWPAPTAAPDRPWLLPIVATGAVLVYYFPTLSAGYFRYDDFDMIQVAREQSLGASLFRPHGDHFLPLTRVLFFLAYHVFGVTAWPYNAWLLACLASVVGVGLRLLAELNVSTPGQLLFIVLVVFWSPAAEIMSGYYILSTYLLIALLSLLAAWCYLRWLRTGRRSFVAGMIAAVFLGPLVDVSGWYVLGVAGVFLLLEIPREGFHGWLRRHSRLLAGLALATVVVLACTLYAYQVRHPGSFLAMASDVPRTPARLAAEFAYLFTAGLLVPLAVPFIYARLPSGLLALLATLALVCWVIAFAFAWRRAEPERRRNLLALLLVVGGICLMLNLGRPNADTLAVRWAAKHVFPAHLWLCLMLCAGWDTLWRKLREMSLLRFAEATVILLVLFVTAQTAFGLLGMAVAFPPFGYPAELRDALRRRAAVEVLRDEVAAPFARRLEASDPVPILDGTYIQAKWPSLFQYNLSCYEAFFGESAGRIDWVRNPAMQPWHTAAVRTVPTLLPVVTPRVVGLLAEDAELRELYFGAARLTPRQPPDKSAWSSPAPEMIASDGEHEIIVRTAAWKPETAPRLRLSLQALDATPGAEVTVQAIFWSESLACDWQGSIVLPASPETITEIDLRQAYAFSLSPQVACLRIRLKQPGRYVIRLAEVVP